MCGLAHYDERALLHASPSYGELAHMANWRMWQNDYGKLAYGEMTSYHLFKLNLNLMFSFPYLIAAIHFFVCY